MKLGIITIALAAAMIFGGCSSSSGPTNSYPLLLTTVSDSIVTNIGVGYFNFRVTKNGTPVVGAKLRQTDSPSNHSFDLGIKSDSGGNFPRVSVALTDTVQGVAYQAVILNSVLKDSLTSNFIHWSL